MAPDLNTVPESPRSRERSSSSTATATAASRPLSRRTSATMPPPPVPSTVSSPGSPRAANNMANFNSIGAGVGPGPIRHPRPMTAAELHLELEKEQEGIVNRLTRELSQLRSQTASVASTTSSASDLFSDHQIIVPTAARRHRSSSNLSTRSITAATTGATSISGVAPARETSVPSSNRRSIETSRPTLSRENSIVFAAGRSSITASPSLQMAHGPGFSGSHHAQPHRQSVNSQSGVSPSESHTHHPRSPSFSAAVAAARYEEAAFHRAELEAVKRENDALRHRIRDLEKTLGTRPSEQGGLNRSRTTSSTG